MTDFTPAAGWIVAAMLAGLWFLCVLWIVTAVDAEVKAAKAEAKYYKAEYMAAMLENERLAKDNRDYRRMIVMD